MNRGPIRSVPFLIVNLAPAKVALPCDAPCV